MNEYINLTLENIDKEHICCAIGDPKHQNGVDKKKEWIKNKLKDGHIFRKLNARGKVFIEFVVEKDGSISSINVVRSADPDLSQEAIRVVKAMPKWIPGMQRDKAVRVRFTIPITFQLR